MEAAEVILDPQVLLRATADVVLFLPSLDVEEIADAVLPDVVLPDVEDVEDVEANIN